MTYLSQDWIHDVDDLRGRSRTDRSLTGKLAAAEAKHERELRAMFVVVAPGEEAKPFPCPIRKEPMKREFLEEDEEWIWKNVMKNDEKVRFLRHNPQ